MKHLFITCLLTIASQSAVAYDNPIVLQLKYSPWGGIDADEDEFEYNFNDDEFSKYDMTFERSYSARLIVSPFYISAQRSTTDLDAEIPDAQVDTLAIGLAGIAYDTFEASFGTYLIGGVGIGLGTFKFKNPDLDDDEMLFEVNGEVGFHFIEHLLLGAGIDFQHFGEFGESKASSWTFYISTGLVF